MEEIEVPTEHLHEEIQERAEEKREKWTLLVALSTALMAVLAAGAGLLAGHHANEALIARVKASDDWNLYQSKSIKQEIAVNTDLIMHSQDHSAAIAKYDKDKADAMNDAREAEHESEEHLSKHVPLASAVTIFQIAIAISAIAILTRRKALWIGGLVLTCAGIVFFVLGILP
jgi:predicted histidine transporter YuiF (NhaC family)